MSKVVEAVDKEATHLLNVHFARYFADPPKQRPKAKQHGGRRQSRGRKARNRERRRD
jgi:hypothetical protein